MTFLCGVCGYVCAADIRCVRIEGWPRTEVLCKRCWYWFHRFLLDHSEGVML